MMTLCYTLFCSNSSVFPYTCLFLIKKKLFVSWAWWLICKDFSTHDVQCSKGLGFKMNIVYYSYTSRCISREYIFLDVEPTDSLGSYKYKKKPNSSDMKSECPTNWNWWFIDPWVRNGSFILHEFPRTNLSLIIHVRHIALLYLH